MKLKLKFAFIWLALSTLNSPLSTLLAQGTAFTYQGRFNTNNAPYTGQAEFQFTLWDAASGGNAVAANNPASVVANVSGGLFTATLDFGSNPFNGQPRFLQIDARTTIGAFIPLMPRQPLTPTPYAIYSAKALMLDGVLPGGQLSGAYPDPVTLNNAANVLAGQGSGLTTLNASQLTLGTVPAGALGNAWKLGGNAGTTADFLGTTDNQSLEFRVNNQRGLRLEYPTVGNVPNLIGGALANTVGAGTQGAVIAGGNANDIGVDSDYSAIGGGQDNDIADNSFHATIAGGANNDIGVDSDYSAIGGGSGNEIGVRSSYSAIGGGQNNKIASNSSSATIAGGNASDIGVDSHYSAIGGGLLNSIADNAPFAVIPGGVGNNVGANASYAFAAGRNAKANHQGAFVWADSHHANFASVRDDEFAIRANGGVRITTVGTGKPILRLNIERSWEFRQLNSGASTALELATSDAGNPKDFIITGNAVGINTTSPGFMLHVNGTAGKPGGGSWSTASDARLKDVGQPFTRGLDDLEKIQPTHYRYSADNALKLPSDREYVGLIAQNVQASIPEAIDDNDSGYLHVNNDPILWTMLNGIKELNQAVEQQRAALKQKATEITELKSRLTALESIIGNLNAKGN